MERKKSRSRYLLPLATIFICSLIYIGIKTFFDLNDYKDTIEKALSAKTNSQVIINGNLDYSLFPPYFTVEKLEMSKRDSSSFFVSKMQIYPSLTSLLLLELRFKEIFIDDFNLKLVKTSSGLFNFADSSQSILEMPKLPEKTPIFNISLSRGNFTFINTFTEDTIKLFNINGILEHISLNNKEGVGLFGNLSLEANLKVDSSSYNWLKLNKREIIFDFIDGKATTEITNRQNSNADELFIVVSDFTKDKYYYTINYTLNNFPYEFLFDKNYSIKGNASTSINLVTLDAANQNLIGNVNGKILFSAKNLTLYNYDIDSLLIVQEQQRNMDLSVVNPLLLAGEFGKNIVGALNFSQPNKFRNNSKSKINNLVSSWEVTDGILNPIEVTLLTEKHMLSISGNIDLGNHSFNNFTISVFDSIGNQKVSQSMNGDFNQYSIETTRNGNN